MKTSCDATSARHGVKNFTSLLSPSDEIKLNKVNPTAVIKTIFAYFVLLFILILLSF